MDLKIPGFSNFRLFKGILLAAMSINTLIMMEIRIPFMNKKVLLKIFSEKTGHHNRTLKNSGYFQGRMQDFRPL
jgi:hypothetical protein